MATKNNGRRDDKDRVGKGTIPVNKIILPKDKLKILYKKYGSSKIAKIFNVSKSTVLRNLYEYNISIKKYPRLPEYWKKALRKKNSVPSCLKGKTKNNNETLAKISNSLKGKKSPRWKPEIHTGEMIKCACGCGGLRSKYDKKGRKKYYIKGHSKKGQFKKGQKAWNEGKKWDAETIKKILTYNAPNKQEKYLIKFFDKYKFPYKFVGDGKIIINGKCPDFINCNGQKKIIEFFGEHWHKLKDEDIKRELYKEYGYNTLFIWGKDIKDEKKLLLKIKNFEEV